MEITKCVVKKDLTPEHHWLSSVMESLKYFLTTVYVYIMKEPWAAEAERPGVVIIVWCEIEISDSSINNGVGMVADIAVQISVCRWMAINKCFISIMFVFSPCHSNVISLHPKSSHSDILRASVHLFYIFSHCLHKCSKPCFPGVVTVMCDAVQVECEHWEICTPDITRTVLSCDVCLRKYTWRTNEGER